MKKLFTVLMIMILSITACFGLTSCTKSDGGSKEKSVESLEQEKTEKKAITAEELEAEIQKQPCYVYSTEYLVQDEEYKALYPDMLVANLRNVSAGDIKTAEIAYVAWDSNGLPQAIDGVSELMYVDFESINLTQGNDLNSWGYNLSSIHLDSNPITSFKAIVASYTDFDGNKWENPLIDDWIRIYKGKKLK